MLYRCYKCKRCLEQDNFSRCKKSKSGLSYLCKECDAIKRANNRGGLSLGVPGDYDRLFLEQYGCCAICQTETPGGKDPRRKRFCIDHDHQTGYVRGLLCIDCNRAIGLLGDNITTIFNAYNYIKKASMPSVSSIRNIIYTTACVIHQSLPILKTMDRKPLPLGLDT